MKKRKAGQPPRTIAEWVQASSSCSSDSDHSSSEQSSPLRALIPVQEQPNIKRKKGTRGQSKGISEWNTGVKVKIDFHPLTFQPVGPRAGQLKSQLGQIVRNGQRVPLNVRDWKKIDNKVKEGIWKEIKKNLMDVPDGYKNVCLDNCNLLWKDHKSKTKQSHYVPHEEDPEISTKNPPHIVAEQWTELVAYWSSEDAKLIAEKNSINREMRGPGPKTGRKHFAQVRYEMERDGEETDKFSVWKKTRDLEDPSVKEFIIEYERKLNEETLEDQQKDSVKDQIFHSMMGEDGHGYCRTYGSTVPHSVIYPKETNLIEKIVAQVRQEFQGKIDELQRRIDHLEGKENNRSEPSIQIPDATSGHEIIRESIGDEVAPRANRSQPLKPVSLETSPSSQNDAQRVFMAKKAKSAKEVVKTTEASQIAESAGPSPSRWAARLISLRNLK